MSLVIFEQHNFEIRTHENEKYFCVQGVQGFVMVYFYTPTCGFCETFTPFFSKLPSVVHGQIMFAICNAANCTSLLSQTVSCTTPIDRVPFIMLFHNGWPVKRYTGPQNNDSVRNFIVTVQKEMSTQAQTSTLAPVAVKQDEPAVEPHKRHAVCYLSYGEAYKPGATMMKRTADA
jgi:thioredoxin-like negative regulator of GroEL